MSTNKAYQLNEVKYKKLIENKENITWNKKQIERKPRPKLACDHCGNICTGKSNLQRHIKDMHFKSYDTKKVRRTQNGHVEIFHNKILKLNPKEKTQTHQVRLNP